MLLASNDDGTLQTNTFITSDERVFVTLLSLETNTIRAGDEQISAGD